MKKMFAAIFCLSGAILCADQPPAQEEAIRAARQEVVVLSGGRLPRQTIDALKSLLRSKNWVKVRVMADRRADIEELIQVGAEAWACRDGVYRLHSKTIVVDRKHVFANGKLSRSISPASSELARWEDFRRNYGEPQKKK